MIGNKIEVTVAINNHVRVCPYRRGGGIDIENRFVFRVVIAMKEFFAEVMNLPVSVGGINNILKRITQKAFR